MSFFNFLEKKETKSCCCCTPTSTEDVQPAPNNGEGNLSVKVLGSGCKKCNDLEENTKAALAELGRDTAIEHISDFIEIAAYGVMSTPALVVDGKVVSSGKVLKTEEIIKLLQK